jgi:hypothetical protein
VCAPSPYTAARDDRDQESQACPSSCNGDKVISVTVAPIRSDIVEKVSAAAAAKLSPPRSYRTVISQVDDHLLLDPVDCSVRFVDKAPRTFGEPVIAPGLGNRSLCPAGRCLSSVTMKARR